MRTDTSMTKGTPFDKGTYSNQILHSTNQSVWQHIPQNAKTQHDTLQLFTVLINDSNTSSTSKRPHDVGSVIDSVSFEVSLGFLNFIGISEFCSVSCVSMHNRREWECLLRSTIISKHKQVLQPLQNTSIHL